jgi:hypothetical protein
MVVQSDPSGPESPAGGPSRPIPVVLLTVGVILLVLAVVLVLVVVKLTNSSPAGRIPTAVQTAPAGLVQAVTTIPAKVFDLVGDPSEPVITGAPVVVHDTAPLTAGGLPAVVWVGALFCPGCAAQRWALVIALGRFGTFDKLYTTMSAASDAFPDTPTFSLEGAEYHSGTVTLSAVEEYGSVASRYAPAGFEPLGHVSAIQAATLKSYDRAPWGKPEVLPFLDVANQMIISGWSFSPGILNGLTMQQIAKDLKDPYDAVAQALLGTANQITAAICVATGGHPAKVCSTPAIRSTENRLGLQSPDF